jgi:hypothetical protein
MLKELWFDSWLGKEFFFVKCPDQLYVAPSLLLSGYQGICAGKKVAERMKMTTQFHLALSLRLSGATSSIPLPLVACTGILPSQQQ